MTRIVLEGAGLTPAGVASVPVSSDGYTSALVHGTIQSGILQEEQVISVLKKDSHLHEVVNFDQADPGCFYGTYVMTRSWLASHQDVAKKFLTAIVRAAAESSLVRTGPIISVMSQLATWSGDPRWH
jgi:ABC-type nitrate/sulfonate/bicarbonate transport system substrate-binding protein